MHLIRRRAFVGNESAEDDAAVSWRQESFGNKHEEPDRAGQTDDPNNWRDPTMSQKPPERFAVSGKYTLFDATDYTFHPCLLRTVTALLQKSRAHQWSQRQRDQAGSKDGNDDGNCELAEDSTNQAGHEHQRNEHGRQRDRHRHNREADLFGAADGCLERLLSA